MTIQISTSTTFASLDQDQLAVAVGGTARMKPHWPVPLPHITLPHLKPIDWGEVGKTALGGAGKGAIDGAIKGVFTGGLTGALRGAAAGAVKGGLVAGGKDILHQEFGLF